MNDMIKPAGNEIVAFCDKILTHYEQLVRDYRAAVSLATDDNYLRNIEYKHHDEVRTLLNKVNNAFDANRDRFTFDYRYLYQTGYRHVFEHKSADYIVGYIFRAMVLDIEQDFVGTSHGTHYGQVFWRDMRAKRHMAVA